jgi:hypothetical protein
MPKIERASAQIVKCPHCSHTGSSRGLFTHIRLAHPGIESKPPKSVKTHPYAINNTSSIGSVETKSIKRKKKQPKGYVSGLSETQEAWIAILTPVVLNLTLNWLERKGYINTQQFQSEGNKLNVTH